MKTCACRGLASAPISTCWVWGDASSRANLPAPNRPRRRGSRRALPGALSVRRVRLACFELGKRQPEKHAPVVAPFDLLDGDEARPLRQVRITQADVAAPHLRRAQRGLQ